jgi:integrase
MLSVARSAIMVSTTFFLNTPPPHEPKCPSLVKKRVTPHVLRHSPAMDLLQHGVDRFVIALWLGHESIEITQVYLHANLKLKEQALV